MRKKKKTFGCWRTGHSVKGCGYKQDRKWEGQSGKKRR